MNGLLLTAGITLVLLYSYPSLIEGTGDFSDLDEFQNWAELHEISLVGINKNSDYYLENEFNSENDLVSLNQVPGIMIAAEALYEIPDDVLQVMKGKTIYFSTGDGRGYAIVSAFPQHGMFVGLERGMFIEQGVTSHQVIHELGHLVDYHGIQGTFNDSENVFSESQLIRNEIFEIDYSNLISEGYVSSYSIINDDENFAEHFAYYVLYGDEFREQMIKEFILEEKYNFLKNNIFNGLEF